jgi:large subunit ribosomal protein L30
MSKKIKVTQIASPIRRQEWQAQCLKGLGLGKMNRSKVLIDTPEVRGMVNKVHHLVTVTEA